MENVGWVIGYDDKEQILKLKLKEPLNLERIQTMYSNDFSRVIAHVDVIDPREFSKAQRRFYYALLNDIERYTGQPAEYSDMYFKRKYVIEHLHEFSFSDNSENTKEHANNIVNTVIDFVLEEKIELKEAFKYIGVHDYWFYASIKKRQCCLCGKKGERAHVQAVGMGRNRKTIDHTKHAFMSLCHEHHKEQHNIGINHFIEKYHIIPVWLTKKDLQDIGLPIYEEENNNGN